MAREAHDAPKAGGPPGSVPTTSLTLLQRLRENEPEAWRTVVLLYHPLVGHWCTRAGVALADVDDVSQEVFSVAAARLEKFRRDRQGDSFRGWLRGITRNFVLLYFRRQNAQPRAAGGTDAHLLLHEVADPIDAQEPDDPPEELLALHRRALDLVRGQVEQHTWQAFWLTAIEDRSPADVAVSLGISQTAVRMAKSRVLRRLKEQFGEVIQ